MQDKKLTVAELRSALAALPSDMEVAVPSSELGLDYARYVSVKQVTVVEKPEVFEGELSSINLHTSENILDVLVIHRTCQP